MGKIMQKKYVLGGITIILITVGLGVGYIMNEKNSQKKDANELEATYNNEKLYMETPKVSTCTSDSNLELQIRFFSNSAKKEITSSNVVSSSPDVEVSKFKLVELNNEDTSKVFTFEVSIKVPKGKSKFDLDFTVDNEKYTLKDIENINFETPEERSEKMFGIHSPYVSKGEKQEFLNEITFYTKDITNAEFFLLGEEVTNIEIKDDKNVHIRSLNDKPSIVGYYYIKDSMSVCIANSYHTEELTNKKQY